jgi:hypothetical protein
MWPETVTPFLVRIRYASRQWENGRTNDFQTSDVKYCMSEISRFFAIVIKRF